ncbi:HPr-rel-A system PqqD family peptide chaperone [Rhizorhabdus sp.]|uniref:HPr-rel-A system PqqD family peptide chaperone n=1 Tax=Rhizorhabdus sp. TaxID=1968843 RepID=UPI0019C6F39E|nr:HPr-rel-A system PqqD family peptide chaperone [Rhizorhabdus sp.]MBD3759691.1 HPr-rel-A system PqqD family peptide chaperone [Rhizorhabdus sp.]
MTAPIYRTDYPGSCRAHAIDGMTLVFHRPSGATHFLDSPVPEMLDLLAAAPDDSAGLARRLCASLDVPDDDEAHAVVATRLAELIAIGLVQTA